MNDRHLAELVANSEDAVISTDLDWTIRTWNAAATWMYGHSADDVRGRSIDVVVPDDESYHAEEADIRRRVARGECVHGLQTVRQRRDGRRIEVSLSVSPMCDASGRVVGASFLARDVSQHDLYLVRQHLAAVVNSSDDAIGSIALDGTILSWNPAAERIYGYTAEEAVGHSIAIALPEGAQYHDEEEAIRLRIARGERLELETVRRRRDGRQFEVALSISPVRDWSGRIVAACAIARDVSERRRLEAERERARGLLERFADFAAHDFKTPVHHILWNAQEALRLIRLCKEELRDERLVQIGRRLDTIVANSFWTDKRNEALLRASMLENHRQRRNRVSAADTFDESLNMLRAVNRDVADADVTRGSLPAVASDEALLTFLFQNLIQNACKFHKVGECAKVRVSARRRQSEWHFVVADNGIGVEEQLREKIFELHTRGTDDTPGTGIGLTFCRRIVEWHGGRIWVDPARGGGSRFSFTIPDWSPTE